MCQSNSNRHKNCYYCSIIDKRRSNTNCKIVYCGDSTQTDLTKSNEKNGILDFKRIIEIMEDDFGVVEFGLDDIVRSGLVRNYLVTKLALSL